MKFIQYNVFDESLNATPKPREGVHISNMNITN